MIAALIYFTETNDILSKRHNILCGVVGIITALLGSAIQISWLQNDNIITNWTIPYKHYFNAAGWYHAFFFIFMFGIFGALLFKFLFTRTISARPKYEINNAKKVNYFLIWFSGCWFLLLYIIDDYQEKYNITLLLQLTALALLIIIIFFNAATAKTIIIEETVCIFSAVLSALGISIALSGSINGLSISAITGFMLSFSYIYHGKSLSAVIANGILISFPVFSLNLALSAVEKNKLISPVFILAVAAPYAIAQIQKNENPIKLSREINKYIFDGTVLELMISTTIILFEVYKEHLEVASSIICLAVDLIAVTYVKSSIEKNFDYLKFVEDKRYSQISEYNKKFLNQKIITYLLIVMVGMGAFSYLLLMLSSYIGLKIF